MDGLGYIREEAIRMRNMGPDHYYENFGGVQDMASQLIGSINHIDQPTYIQTNPVNLEADNTIPQRARRGRGRRARQPTRRNPIPNVDNDDDDDGEGTQHFGGQTPNYGEGTGQFAGETHNSGEGTSHFGGPTQNYGEGTSHSWGDGYRPSFEDFGQGSSNPDNSWVSSFFEYTPTNNMIPEVSSYQGQPFQDYDYTGVNVQEEEPRYQHLTPVPLNLDPQLTHPLPLPEQPVPEQPVQRRVQPPRDPKPRIYHTGGQLHQHGRRRRR